MAHVADPGQDRVLAFAHLGDLHLTDAKHRNFTDFLAIVAQIEVDASKAIQFLVLPRRQHGRLERAYRQMLGRDRATVGRSKRSGALSRNTPI